jgi:hypothetical protein
MSSFGEPSSTMETLTRETLTRALSDRRPSKTSQCVTCLLARWKGCQLLLMALLGLTLAMSVPASAIPFFGKKNEKAPTYPPAMRISPELSAPQPAAKAKSTKGVQPSAQPTDKSQTVYPVPATTGTNPATPVTAPAATAKDAAPVVPSLVDLTRTLVNKQIFSPEMADQTEPLTRAELADVMVKAMAYNQGLYETFPFYRDIATENPHYVVIEVAREKKLLTYPNDHGFYHPDKPVTYADVYTAIAHAITGPIPTPELTDHLLARFPDKDTLNPDDAKNAAKMAYAHFFTPESGTDRAALEVNNTLKPNELAPFIVYLQRLGQDRASFNARAEIVTPVLPAGLALTLSPVTSYVEAQMSPGQSLAFTLVNAVDPLPKNSRLTGTVQSIPNPRAYLLNITEARTPEGDSFQLSAPITISFGPRRRNAFIVPGQLYQTVTESTGFSNAAGSGGTPSTSPNVAPPFEPNGIKANQLPAPGQGANRPGTTPGNNLQEAPKPLPSPAPSSTTTTPPASNGTSK